MAAKTEVLCLINHSHAALADGVEDAIMGDDLSLQQGCCALVLIGSDGFG
jgi:hypothetical protein